MPNLEELKQTLREAGFRSDESGELWSRLHWGGSIVDRVIITPPNEKGYPGGYQLLLDSDLATLPAVLQAAVAEVGKRLLSNPVLETFTFELEPVAEGTV